MGLNSLHLTNQQREMNIFRLIWPPLRANMCHVTFRGILRCLIGSRASCRRHVRFLGFVLQF